MERLMTTEEVAEILRIEAVTVRRLVARGELAAYRIAGEYRFTTAGVENFIESQQVVLNPATTVQLGRFTDRARKVFDLADEEARSSNHRGIGPEHLLLAIVRVEEGVGARALKSLHVQLVDTRKQIETLHPADEQPVPNSRVGLTSQGKDTMELAVQEARSFEHHYIGTEHLLLGLLRQENSVAGRVLLKSGVTHEKARDLISQMLAVESAASSSEQEPPEGDRKL